MRTRSIDSPIVRRASYVVRRRIARTPRTTYDARRTVLRNIPPLQSQQIYEETVGTRYTGRQLSEEAESGVHISPPSEWRDQQAPLELHRRSARIMGFEQRDVGRVPGVAEVQPPLLNPTAPILRPDGVWIVKDGMRGIELGDGRGFIGYAIVRARDGQRIGCVAAIDERILLILNDDEPAVARVVEQPPVVRDERWIGFVRPAADHDRIEVRQIAARERVGADELDRHPDGHQRFGHAVGGATHIADV